MAKPIKKVRLPEDVLANSVKVERYKMERDRKREMGLIP